MYFAGLSTNFCHSMVAISAFVEKLWSTYTRFFFDDGDRMWVASLTKCFLLVKTWSESGPKEAPNSFKYCWMFFVLQKIEVCYLLLNCWCLLNELDVIVFVINRRLFDRDRKLKWRCVFNNNLIVICLKTFCLYCYFSVFVVE